MYQSQKSTEEDRCLTSTCAPGPFKSCATIDQLGEKQEKEMKAVELVNRDRTLCSSTARYETIDFLGEGSFGRVMKCREEGTRKMVAVKATKSGHNVRYYINERNILQKLNEHDPEKYHIIRLLNSFSLGYQGYLVFELLEQSLYDALDGPLPLPGILHIMSQVLSALVKMKELRIVHTDIKPQNIMFVDSKSSPLHVKLIDFNSAIQLPAPLLPRTVQPLFYRAPEVILGLPYDEGIDMWSAGCVFAEMLTGLPLHPALTEYHAIKFVYDSQGLPPNDMLNCGKSVKRYFTKEVITGDVFGKVEKRWRLKTPDEYEDETGERYSDTRTYTIMDLDQILESKHLVLEESTIIQCAALLRMMLAVDQEDRISPESALNSTVIDEFDDLPEDVKRFTCEYFGSVS